MNLSNYGLMILAALLINGLMGCLLYSVWKAVIRLFPKKMDIQLAYIALRLILLFFLIPVFGFLRLGQFSSNEYWSVISELLGSELMEAAKIIGILWLAGSLALFGRHVFVHVKMHCYSRIGSTPAKVEWQRSAEEVRRRIRLQRRVTIRERYGDGTAFIMGIFRPVIYVPMRRFGEEERRVILLHEMTHIQEMDLLWKWIADICRCIYWPLPVLWLIGRDVQDWSEFNCDCVSCGVLGSAKMYFNLIQDMIADEYRWLRSPWVAWLGQSAGELIGRMRRMANQQKLSPMRKRWVFIMVSLLLFAGSTTVSAATFSTLVRYRDSYWENLDVVYEDATPEWATVYRMEPGWEEGRQIVTVEDWDGDPEDLQETNTEHAYFFNWVIPEGIVFLGQPMEGRRGDRRTIACCGDNDGERILVGLWEEDGTVQYAVTGPDITANFTLNSDGVYRFFACSETEGNVYLNGYLVEASALNE